MGTESDTLTLSAGLSAWFKLKPFYYPVRAGKIVRGISAWNEKSWSAPRECDSIKGLCTALICRNLGCINAQRNSIIIFPRCRNTCTKLWRTRLFQTRIQRGMEQISPPKSCFFGWTERISSNNTLFFNFQNPFWINMLRNNRNSLQSFDFNLFKFWFPILFQ